MRKDEIFISRFLDLLNLTRTSIRTSSRQVYKASRVLTFEFYTFPETLKEVCGRLLNSELQVHGQQSKPLTPGKGACDSGGLHSTFFGQAHWPNFFWCLWDSFGRSLGFGYSRLSLCVNGYKRSQNVGTTSEFSVTRPLVKAGPMWKGVLKVPYYCSLNRPGSHPYTWPLEQILCFFFGGAGGVRLGLPPFNRTASI